MFQDRCYDRDNEITANFFGDNNQISNEMNMSFDSDVNTPAMDPGMNMDNTIQPIVGPVKERCVHRNIYHEVPHVCPNMLYKYNV